jgi:TP901 family phage tail tape measure protein
MADVNANIGVNIDTSEALAQLKALQRQISQFHTSIAKSSEAAGLAQRDLQKNFINSVNATGAFSAELRTVKTTSESFTNSLEKNKFSMREYFRYSGASTKTFGRLFKSEFDTIGKVAEDRVKKLQTQYIKLGRDSSGAMKAIAVMPNQLDMGNFSTQTQLAAQKQAIFNQLIKQGSTNLLNFGKNTQWAGRQLMVGFTLPLASLGMVASRTFMEMEAQTIKFRKVYGDLFTPTEETNQALDSITALGQMFTKYGVAVSQTVGLAAEAAAAGFQGVDLQRQTTEATRLSVLGQIDAQKALETTISLQNAFKMSSENLASSIDFLNAVENQTVVSLDDITTAIPKVAPVIQQLGGDVKDLAFFMAAMKEGGINASEGANALKSGLASLINPSTKAAAMLQGVGINMKELVESNQGDLKATVIDFANALDTLDPLTRARAIEQLFGKFQFARLSTLFDNVTNETGQAARVLELAGSSIEDLSALSEKELGLTADSAMNKFRKSVEDLKLALVPVGQTFLEAVTPIVEFLGGILEKFNNLSSGVKRALVILTVAIGAIGPIALMTFGLLANAFANIIKGVMVLRNGYLRLTGQSQILGEQTEYLTMEQIDAAAAAHSLDQSHARLTQTFTAESSAIAKLIAAYQQAASAGAKFAAINPGMMRVPGGTSPKKFAVGGVVPGTGNGDTVPAMLTPGEFVVTKDATEEFLPLLMQLNKKRIGFNEGGLVKGYRNATTYMPESINTLMGQTSGRGVPTSDYTRYVGQAGAAGQAPLLAVIARQLGEKLNDPSVTQEFAKVGDLFAQTTVRALNESGVEFVKDIDIEQIVVPALRDAAKGITVAGKEIDTALENSINQIRTFGPVGGGGTAAGGQSRSSSPMSYINERRNASTFAIANNPAMFQGTTRVSSTGKTKKSFQTLNPSSGQFEQATMAHLGQSIVTTSENLTKEVSPYVKDAASRILKITKKQIEQGVVAEAKISSPSKETKKVGADIGRGFIAGAQEYVDDAKAIGQQIGGSATGSNLAQASRSSLYGSGPIDPVQKSIRRNQMKMSEIGQSASMSAKTTESIEKEVAARKTSQQRLSSMNSALMGGTFALTSLAGAGSMASGPLGDISRQVMKYSGLLFGLMSVTQLLTQTKIAELVATRAGLAKSAMANAMAAGPMFGGVSKALSGQAGLLGSIARVGTGLLKFLGPVGLITTGLLGTVSIIKMSNAARERERLAIEGLADAMETTTSQGKALGDFFGVAPKKLPFDLGQKEIVGLAKRTERETLKDDPGFQAEFKTTIEQLRKATNEEAKLVFSGLALNLRAQGFATEQVQTIVDSLREESRQTDVKLDVKSLSLSKESLDQIKQDITPLMVSLNSALKTGTKIVDAYSVNGEIKVKKYSTEVQRNLSTLSRFISKTAKSSAGLFEAGLITGPEYKATIDTLIESTQGLGEEQTKLLLLNVFKKLGDGAASLVAGLKTAQEQTLALGMLSAGIISSTDTRLRVLNETADPRVRKEILAGLTTQYERFFDIVKKTTDEEKKGTISGSDTEKGKVNAIKAKTLAILQQTEAYKILRSKNIDNATATELSNDAEIAALVIKSAINKTLPKTIKLINQYIAALKGQKAAAEAGMSEEETFKFNLSRNVAIANLREKLIDIQFAAELKRENDQLASQEKALESVNDQIDAITKTDIDPLQKQIAANNFALEGIALQEDAINEKYETQISALDKIASINQEINNIQKQRMSIADALTRGDISAAAQAVQEARAQQAESAISGQRNALTSGRDAAINALGRNALEKANKQLQYDISVIEKTKLLTFRDQKIELEGQIQTSKRLIADTELQIKNLKEQAVYAGKTKEQLDLQEELIRLAEAAGVDYKEVLDGQLITADELLKRILALETTVTTKHIIETTYTTGGSGPGPGGPAPDKEPVTPPGGPGGNDTGGKIDEPFKFTPGQQNLSDAAKQGIINSAKQDQAMANRAADAAKAATAAATAKVVTLAKQDQAMANRAADTAKAVATAKTVTLAKQDAAMAGRAPIKRSMGGLIPKYMAAGGFAKGTDTVPAMLTPGEFVVKKFAVDSFGVDNLRDINNGTFSDKSKSGKNDSSSVYNYGINVNVANSNASTDEIARAVITQIKNIDNQRIRGQKY